MSQQMGKLHERMRRDMQNTFGYWIGMIALCATGIGISVNAGADDAATRKDIVKQYDRISAALKAKSLKSIDKVTTPDYTLKAPEGQVITWKQMEAQMGLYLSFLQKVTEASSTISKVAVKGKEAKVDVKQSFSGVIADPQTEGKVHKVTSSTQYKDTWIKSNGGWLLKHSDIVATNYSMDGKKVDMASVFSGGAGGGAGMGAVPGRPGAPRAETRQ